MEIQALGHACFAVECENGVRVVFDPFDDSVGYDVPRVKADIVCLSHEHHDHGYAEAIEGTPLVLRKADTADLGGAHVYSVASFHDENGGAQRGENAIFVLEAEGLRIAHMGDIGHMLSDEQIEKIGKLDVLLLPVGGVFTVDALGAKKIADALGARVVIPMHYQSARLTLGKRIGSLEAFTRQYAHVKQLATDTLTIFAGDEASGVIVPKLP